MNALVGTGRLNAFRLNDIPLGLKKIRDNTIRITQDDVPLRVRLHSVSIHDVINDAPNTCTLVADHDTPPTTGARLKITQGVDPAYLLFVGRIQGSNYTYVGRATERQWQVEAIDDTARSDWYRPFGAWEGYSASQVALELMNNYTLQPTSIPFSTAGVQANLPVVTLYLDGSERMAGALKLIAKLIGGYYYFEDYTLHLFTGDEPGLNPDDITGAPGQLLDDPPITATTDDSQIRTRCYGKGHSEATLAAVNASETLLPIANAVMFNPLGGKAIIEWRRIAYTGTAIGGTGALVGPGVTPSSPLTLALANGGAVDPGVHQYAYAWVTAAGQTLPSPLASITIIGTVAAPVLTSVSSGVLTGGPVAGTQLRYAIAIGDGAQQSPPSLITTITATGMRPVISFYTTVDMAGRYVYCYRSDNGGPWATISVLGSPPGSFTPFPPGQPAGYIQNWTDATVSQTGGTPSPPAGGTLTSATVSVTGMAVGPAGVTARRIWRTVANGSTWKYVGPFNDNTTTSFTDPNSDATYGTGVAFPVADTSGLQMPAGQVLPGAASLPVSSTVWALTGGGWAVIGNGQQVIRYSGISGNTITGIPASGPGAILAAVNYNSTITGAPLLLGVTGISSAVRQGSPVNIWVQVDDTAAQTALAARVGGNGAIEHLISDERRGEASLIALCTADLALYSRPIVTVRYTCFDPKSRSGRPVRINLPALGIDTTLLIQDVAIELSGEFPTRFTVTASSVRNSLEDLLRRMSATLDEGF